MWYVSMNLSPDIIFRIIITIILVAVATKALWSIFKNFLDHSTIGKQDKIELNSLIEQQKHLLSLKPTLGDEEVQQLLSKIQWGDEDILKTLRTIFIESLDFTPSDEQLKQGLVPLKQNIGKATNINKISYAQCINVCTFIILHYLLKSCSVEELTLKLHNRYGKSPNDYNLSQSVIESALNHLNKNLAQYLEKPHN